MMTGPDLSERSGAAALTRTWHRSATGWWADKKQAKADERGRCPVCEPLVRDDVARYGALHAVRLAMLPFPSLACPAGHVRRTLHEDWGNR